MFMSTTIWGIKQRFPDVDNVSTDQLDSWLKEDGAKVKLFDCRPENEYNISRLAGAERVDYTNNTEELKPILSELVQDSKVVCYCSVGYRSSTVAQKLKEEAKDKNIKVYNLEGSLFKWANENRPMIDSNGQNTVYVHPYNNVFGQLLRAELRKDTLNKL